MRRTSGVAGAGTRQAAVATEFEQQGCVWWEARLLPYRHIVLFLWSALSFSPSTLPGVGLWLVAHVLLGSFLRLTGSVLEVCGNLLVMLAVLYALLQLGLRYGNLSMRQSAQQQRNKQDVTERSFKELCSQVATSSRLIGLALTNALYSRHLTPNKFYGIGFGLSFLLYYLGQWLSTAACLHITISVVLLVPLMLECHKPQPELLKDKLLRARAELVALLANLLATLKQTLKRTKTR